MSEAQGRTERGAACAAASPRAGRVTAVSGSVIDIAFPADELPPINSALDVDWDGPHRLIVEVQQHVDPRSVRGVAIQETAGLRSGVTGPQSGALTPFGRLARGGQTPYVQRTRP